MGSMADINLSPACLAGNPSRTIAVSGKGRALQRPLPTQSQKEDNYGHHTAFNRGPVPALSL
jgi:hypothetical protein